MKINLDREDLIKLVKSSSPHYSIFEYPLIKRNGIFVDNLIKEELFEIYFVCKNYFLY